jgi:hypothetical protein
MRGQAATARLSTQPALSLPTTVNVCVPDQAARGLPGPESFRTAYVYRIRLPGLAMCAERRHLGRSGRTCVEVYGLSR